MVFVGLDDEANPGCGGIFRAPLAADPPLTTLVAIGSVVPGAPDATFTRLGEGLSYDGRYVGFWGAWGDATRTVRLDCPAEGNRDRVDYCNHTGRFAGGLGDPRSVCDGVGPCYQEAEVPVDQGIFVHDVRTGQTRPVAVTGGAIEDLVYWGYSGRVPGASGSEGDDGGHDEGDDGEAVRWRSSSYLAVSSSGGTVRTAFKAKSGAVDGIYLSRRPGQMPLIRVVDTTMAGLDLDPEAPAGSTITAVGLEREGFRGRFLVVGARMGDEGTEDAAAGIYLTTP